MFTTAVLLHNFAQSFGSGAIDRMDTLTRLTQVLRETLVLDDDAERFDPDMRLLGALPALDSIAVVSVLTAIENEFGITVDDDEMSAEVFESVGSLLHFVSGKLDARVVQR